MVAFASPILDAAGHRGVRVELVSGQAFCSVVNRDGSCLGRLTFTLRCSRPARAWSDRQLHARLAPFLRDVFPDVEAVNFGLNASSRSYRPGTARTRSRCTEVLVSVLDDRQRVAAGRVHGEVGPVDRDADVADVRDDPVDDRRDRFRAASIDRDCGVSGSIRRPNRITTVPRSTGRSSPRSRTAKRVAVEGPAR